MNFSAEILAAGGGGHAVVLPPEIASQLSEKRPRVLALVNGTEYRSRIAVYGGKSFLGLRKDLLQTIAADTGDTVEVELSEESESEPKPEPERVLSEPVELTDVLAADASARAAFDQLPPSHQREYFRWVAEAVRPETRTERARKTAHRLQP